MHTSLHQEGSALSISEEQIKQCQTDHDLAYFRAEVCVESPESFSLEEKQQIVQDMDLSDIAIDELMRQDFQSMPPEAQAAMFNLLCGSNTEAVAFWEEVLDYHAA